MRIKIKSTFSFSKLAKYVKSQEFNKFSNNSIVNPMVKDSKAYIKANKVTPATHPNTLKERRKRKSPKSIGGNTTLYDTGVLHDSIKKAEGMGVEFVKYGLKHITGDRVPERNFLVLDPKNSLKISNDIVKKFKKIFTTRLAK